MTPSEHGDVGDYDADDGDEGDDDKDGLGYGSVNS